MRAELKTACLFDDPKKDSDSLFQGKLAHHLHSDKGTTAVIYMETCNGSPRYEDCLLSSANHTYFLLTFFLYNLPYLQNIYHA